MRAPAFWWLPQPDALSLALSPIGFLWGAISERRLKQTGARAGLPVICVGNFVAGGAGKTPAAMALAKILQSHGKRPVFLTRGYGGSASRAGTPLRVDPAVHDARTTGDEALLLARIAPVIVTANRVAGAHAAQMTGGDIIIMDDGLQNPSLTKDFSIAIADGETGTGNGRCIPAGPLRAPLDSQLGIIDALIVVGAGEAGDRLAGRAKARGVAIFRAHLRPDPEAAERLRGQRAVAFAGIGRPEKFFATLEAVGAEVMDAYSFDDHQMIDAGNMQELRASARKHMAQLVTTEKDLARLSGVHDISGIDVLPVTLGIEDEPGFTGMMMRKIFAA